MNNFSFLKVIVKKGTAMALLFLFSFALPASAQGINRPS